MCGYNDRHLFSIDEVLMDLENNRIPKHYVQEHYENQVEEQELESHQVQVFIIVIDGIDILLT